MSYRADPARRATLAGRLARLGFADAARAERMIGELRLDGQLIGVLADAADPDLALTGLARLLQPATTAAGLRTAAAEEPAFARRLTAVLGASAALADHLARHPGDWRALRGEGALRRPAAEELRAVLLQAVGAAPGDPEPAAEAGPGAAGDALRRLPPRAAAPGGQGSDRRDHPGRDRGRARRPGSGRARGGPGGGPVAAARPARQRPGLR